MVDHPSSAGDLRARAPITDRVNVEPAILNGMTVTEAKWIALASFLLFVVLGAAIYLITGFWQAPTLLLLAGPVVVLWFGSQYLARLKRGRPDGFYGQALNLWLARRGLAQPLFLMHRGFWSLGREADFSLASPLHPPAETFHDLAQRPVDRHE